MTVSQDQQLADEQARCRTVMGLLEAAAMLVARVSTEGPTRNPFGADVAAINRQIQALQQQALKLHDQGMEGQRRK